MPFKSQAQRAFLYSQHPDIAAKFQQDTRQAENLPRHVKPNLPKKPSSPWMDMGGPGKNNKEMDDGPANN